MDRREFLMWSGVATGAAAVAKVGGVAAAQEPAHPGGHGGAVGAATGATGASAPSVPAAPTRTRVVAPSGQVGVHTPNGSTLPWRVVDGVKVGHLVAEEVDHEFAQGIRARCWGYNGGTPGPTIEAIEGDRLRIYVTNRLPEPTTVHWHGIILPNGMDGVAGLTQRPIPPGETYVYELVVRHAGTFMYHPHYDEMTQMALGMMGMFVVHPRRPQGPRVDRDFALMTSEWKLEPGAARPDPNAMNDFNLLTFNGKAFPATEPLMIQKGERVRIRFGNLGAMDHHPIHLHGVSFHETATDGGFAPPSAQRPETTVLVPVGTTRVIELVPTESGDWPMHCHMTHHAMTQMGHARSTVGADTRTLDRRMSRVLPSYMSMGQRGMGGMGEMPMPVPSNSAPMRGAEGPFSYIDMGGMFTILKVRDDVASADPSGWYRHPAGTVAGPADPARMRADGIDGGSGESR